MKHEKQGITVAGSLIADTFYKIDTYPEAGMLTKARDPVSYVGGTGNLIQDLAKMDPELPIRVSALVGADENGDLHRYGRRRVSTGDGRLCEESGSL